MELKDYIRVIRRRLGWFITVMVVVLGGYLAVANATKKRVFYARVDLIAGVSRTASLFEGLQSYFPSSSKMSFDTRVEAIKTQEIADVAALYLSDPGYTADSERFFDRERKAADVRAQRYRDQVLADLKEKHAGVPEAELIQANGAAIDEAVNKRRTYDPKTSRWQGQMGVWQEEYVTRISASIDRIYGVEKIEKTQVVRITIHADSPPKTVAIANALAEAAIYHNREFDNRELDSARAVARRRVVENQQRLAELRGRLKEYWKTRNVGQHDYFTSEQFYKRISDLQGEVDKLEGDFLRQDDEQGRLAAQREMERARFPEFSFPKDSILAQLLNQRSMEEKGLESLRTRYTEVHPDVKKAQLAIEDLKRQYADALRKYQENEVRDYAHQKAVLDLERGFIKHEIERKRELLATLEVQRAKVDEYKIDEQEMLSLQQQYENENKTLMNFLGLAELYADSAAKPLDRFRNHPLELKDAWEDPSNVYEMMWFMFVVAFLLSLGVVFLVEYMDTTLKTEHDIRRHLNLPVLGIIHHQRDGDGVLLTDLPTKDAFSERFYTAATIIKSAAQDLGLKTFVVSSTVPKEGKTTITINLGVAMARKGLKVIIVDSDLRIPQIHELLGLDNAYGLSSVLEGRLKAKEILADIAGVEGGQSKPSLESFLRKTSLENLRVLPSGPIPADPLSLLDSLRMKALIEELKGMADFVLFDTPPSPTSATPLRSRPFAMRPSSWSALARSNSTRSPGPSTCCRTSRPTSSVASSTTR